MNYETLAIERRGAVATIWMDRPEVFNAFNAALHAVDGIDTGIVYVNAPTIGAEIFPGMRNENGQLERYLNEGGKLAHTGETAQYYGLLGGSVGLGTVAFALLIGPLINIALPIFRVPERP